MQTKQTHIPLVRQWCESLGIASAVSLTRREADLKLAAYLPMLADRFPDGAFTAASLEYCAAQAVKGFPTYGELASWLADWWKAHRPAPPPQITVEGSSIEAERRERERKNAESWDDPHRIRQSVEECQGSITLLRLLARCVSHYAPQHRGLIPPHILDLIERDPENDLGRVREPVPVVRALHLTPEQIEIAGGRKRHEVSADSPPPHDRTAETSEAAYPARGDEA
jgi:hypothetical protein